MSTVGLNKQTIKNYIKMQELEDKKSGERNIKEYQALFLGCVGVDGSWQTKKDSMWSLPVTHLYRIT